MSNLNCYYKFSNSKIDVVSFGEMLVDFISQKNEVLLSKAEEFTRHFGGSAANVTVNLRRLGVKTRLITRIGDDAFGHFLLDVLNKENINTNGIQIDQKRKTPLVFINKTAGTPAWVAYRAADKYLEFNEKVEYLIKNAKILYLTTFIISQNPARKVALKILNMIKENPKKLLAFDPCYRPSLWSDSKMGKSLVKKIIALSDFIKPSLDDAKIFFGTESPENYIDKYLQLGANIVILTMGKDGVLFSDGKTKIHLPSYADEVVDVTGAGDAFWAGFITAILDGMSVKKAVELGNITAVFKIRGIGALSPIPSKKHLIKFMKKQEASQ
ncbi:MAG: sugar kinase [Halanaerobiales bacterium]|nr:sugar kinase [Halanaerobiales bacterium]